MARETVAEFDGRKVIIMDSITHVEEGDTDQIVVSASHGGVSSGGFACEHRLGAVFFNDAGVGKENAGIAALDTGRRGRHREQRVGEDRGRPGPLGERRHLAPKRDRAQRGVARGRAPARGHLLRLRYRLRPHRRLDAMIAARHRREGGPCPRTAS
jgi:hypothetical protein